MEKLPFALVDASAGSLRSICSNDGQETEWLDQLRALINDENIKGVLG